MQKVAEILLLSVQNCEGELWFLSRRCWCMVLVREVWRRVVVLVRGGVGGIGERSVKESCGSCGRVVSSYLQPTGQVKATWLISSCNDLFQCTCPRTLKIFLAPALGLWKEYLLSRSLATFPTRRIACLLLWLWPLTSKFIHSTPWVVQAILVDRCTDQIGCQVGWHLSCASLCSSFSDCVILLSI